ncbi:hypothetical protein CHS0354_041783 [Potamilus streckersoni]|uniref:Glycosyltransferase 61 catalytic domain-containing protein n=1 Tax=Potamilus streckersoni TaxID=2493646 RepID=A0AAE0W6C0_9BIVA|nr:hypothetical protein CHS0354_041783 [Potamilus streckersoni]
MQKQNLGIKMLYETGKAWTRAIARLSLTTARKPLRQKITILFPILIIAYIIYHLVNIQNRDTRQFIDVWKWWENPYEACDGNFVGYGHEFAWLKMATVDPARPGVFAIHCNDWTMPSYSFEYGKEYTHLISWMSFLERAKWKTPESSGHPVDDTVTFAVQRYESHNLYHTMTEWYNIYFLCRRFKIDMKKVNVLFTNYQPRGHMEDAWDTLFHNISFVKDLKQTTIYKHLIWNILSYESPLNFHWQHHLPWAKGFSEKFVQSFGLNLDKQLECSNLTVLIIWRRDYKNFASDKNKRTLFRKIKNEAEVLEHVQKNLINAKIHDVVLEEIPFKQQLELVVKTDILIAMHGAGNAFTMFLPHHAVLFELFPNYWGLQAHFRAFARWRKLKYHYWMNEDPANEFPNYYTYIPPSIIDSNMKEIKNELCGHPRLAEL